MFDAGSDDDDDDDGGCVPYSVRGAVRRRGRSQQGMQQKVRVMSHGVGCCHVESCL